MNVKQMAKKINFMATKNIQNLVKIFIGFLLKPLVGAFYLSRPTT